MANPNMHPLHVGNIRSEQASITGANTARSAPGATNNVSCFVAGAQGSLVEKIRAIANTDSVRSPALPDVPTVAEQGVAGFEFSPWQGWLAPAGVQPAIVRKLEREFIAAVKLPDILDAMAKTGTVPIGGSGEQFRKLLATELVRWRKVAQDHNIFAED